MLRQFLTAAGAMLAALAALPGAASAQDTPGRVTTGFRVEGLLGYEDVGFDSITRGDGMLYGVGVGYDIGWGRMRLALEAEASDSTARTCAPLNVNGPAGTICLRAGRDLYVGARIGGEISPGVLLYGKAGYTNWRETALFPPSVGSIVTHRNADGIRAGLGAEFAVGRRAFVKTEYRYSLYENAQDFDRHQAVIGFGIRF